MKYGAVNFFEKPPNLKKLLDEIREFSSRDSASRLPGDDALPPRPGS